jgi:hypothetical protein
MLRVQMDVGFFFNFGLEFECLFWSRLFRVKAPLRYSRLLFLFDDGLSSVE